MRLSSHDASFLYTETASGPMHGVALQTLEGHVGFHEVLKYVESRLHLIPRLRQKLAFVPFNFAHPKWIDDPDFRIENHVKPHPVPPGTSLNEAKQIALKLGEPLLDRRRPLWLFYVIENVEDKTLIVQMTHHAFVDGATAIAINTVLTDPSPEPQDLPPAPDWQPAPEPSQTALWQEAAAEQMTASIEAFRPSSFDAAESQRAVELMQRLSLPIIQAPWNRGLVGPKRALTSLSFQLEEFKPIRAALGGTINDIALSIVSEGAARYIAEKGTNAANQNFRIMCPVNIRGSSDDPLDPVAGNRVSAMFVVLSAGPGQIADRYQEVCTETAGIKSRGEPETLDALQHAAPSTPPVAMSATLGVGTPFDPTQWAARTPAPVAPNFGLASQQVGFNFTLTNIPGPTWTQYVAGHRVLDTVGTLMIGGNLGLGINMSSFDGRMTIAFTVEPRLLPDYERFKELVATAYAELAALAAND